MWVALACGAWAGAADAPKSDEARLQGMWIGRVVGGSPRDQVTLTVRGNQAEFKGGDPEKQYKGKLVLNPAANPKQVDFVVQECSAAEYVGKSALGIYKLDDDATLTLASNEPGVETRAQTFERGEGRVVFVFRKAQPGSLGATPLPLDDPATRSPEQKVLDHLLGTWRSEVTTFKAEWTPETKTTTGRHTSARVLGGHFVQEKGVDPAEDHLTLYTYDPQRKAYRAWWFSSMGQANESAGKWDGETRTLTWTAPAGEGRTVTAQHRFVGDDGAEWSIVTKDDAGKVYFRMEGKNTRVKEAKE
jgi:uncharacterized protein (TIGR03067 family)